MIVQADVLLPGPAVSGTALALSAPISFWGGVNPRSGDIADPRHPDFGRRTTGQVLLIPATVGSVSASAILLELVHGGVAPAAIAMHEPDAILLLGLIVAKEMGLETPIALRLHRDRYAALDGRRINVSAEGVIAVGEATGSV